jgi:hypothetical protein
MAKSPSAIDKVLSFVKTKKIKFIDLMHGKVPERINFFSSSFPFLF